MEVVADIAEGVVKGLIDALWTNLRKKGSQSADPACRDLVAWADGQYQAIHGRKASAMKERPDHWLPKHWCNGSTMRCNVRDAFSAEYKELEGEIKRRKKNLGC